MITSFRDANRFLSNFWPAVVYFKDNVEGRWYPTVEHAYQAAKSLDKRDRKEIAEAPKPGDAKRLGNQVGIRHDWETVKLQIMEELVRQKFFKYPELGARLLATGNEELIEGNTWGDKFWGCVSKTNTSGKKEWVGQNHLGKILMKIRDDYKNHVQTISTFCRGVK
jgi:ribA/ribD-fused uncharacterized protein